MSIEEILSTAESKMAKSVEATRHEFSLIRTGRANPAILEHVMVAAYGTEMPLQQLASITVPEPRQLLITPFDRNTLASIEKAILKSELNLTPINDGQTIRLNIPPLTEERRKELIKTLHRKAEQGHAAVRNVRQEAHNHLRAVQKAKECSEDEEKRAQESLQKLTDRYIRMIDEAAKLKEKELLEI